MVNHILSLKRDVYLKSFKFLGDPQITCNYFKENWLDLPRFNHWVNDDQEQQIMCGDDYIPSNWTAEYNNTRKVI